MPARKAAAKTPKRAIVSKTPRRAKATAKTPKRKPVKKALQAFQATRAVRASDKAVCHSSMCQGTKVHPVNARIVPFGPYNIRVVGKCPNCGHNLSGIVKK